MHRNSQKRIYGDYVYFITSCVDGNAEYFREKFFCELWINELRMAKEVHKIELFAFCLNYDHFHLLIKPNNEIANYSEFVKFLKRNFSQNMNKIMGYNKFNLHYAGDNANNLSSAGDNANNLSSAGDNANNLSSAG
ncbi:MAG: transposase, partial [Candidatus Cloacimonetes bacterium]|nr:transposase [Candidatus Cloacimonadota bacterium]